MAIVLLGSGLAWFARYERNAAADETRAGATIHLEPFVLNLEDPNQKAYLRIGLDVGVGRTPSSSEIQAAVPVLRDTVIQILSRCQPDQMLAAEGKQKLKSDLVQALRQREPALAVREVYFTDFLVQR